MTDFERGYNTDPDELKLVAILDALYAARDQDQGVGLELGSILPDMAGLSDDQLFAAVARLKDRQLIEVPGDSMGPMAERGVQLTDRGEGAVRTLNETRDDTNKRRRVCEEAILYWLDQQSHAGQPLPDVSAFQNSSYGVVFGRPFSPEDVQFAGKWLAERGLIKVLGAWQQQVIRMGPLPKGQDIVENGETIDDWLRRTRAAGAAPVSTVTNYTFGNVDNVNVRDHSPGGTQVINVETLPEHSELTAAVANALIGMVAVLGLNAQQQAEAKQVAVDLRAAAEDSSPDRSRLKELFDKAATIAVAGVAPEAGHGVVTLVHHALKALGLV